MRRFTMGLLCGIILTASVAYTAEIATPTISDMKLRMAIGYSEQMITEPIILHNSRAYAPIRAVVERLGANVHYDEGTQTIIIFKRTWTGDSIKDPMWDMVRVGNLRLSREGNATRVSGDIEIDYPGENAIGATLMFYDSDHQLIGSAMITGSFCQGVRSFETVGEGDFSDYATVELYVSMLNHSIRHP